MANILKRRKETNTHTQVIKDLCYFYFFETLLQAITSLLEKQKSEEE